VPFLRFSRDKRGYENTYLCETVHRRGKPARTKILYWFRSPPGVKVGRQPFDEEVRKTLEAQNPGVRFDWPTLVATPMPAPEPEPWWEKRRAERQARQARRADDNDVEEVPEPTLAVEPEPQVPEVETLTAIAVPIEEGDLGGEEDDDVEERPRPAGGAPVETAASPGGQSRSGRRRRRGGRRRRGQRAPSSSSETAEVSPAPGQAEPLQEQKSESRPESTETPPPSSEG